MLNSRRTFLKSGVLGAVAAVASPAVLAQKSVDSDKINWDKTFDVIVVGSGLAGFVAGVTAAEKGKNTIILEKMGTLGGSSVISGGTFAACNTKAQAEQG